MLGPDESPTYIAWYSKICEECDCQEDGEDMDAYCVDHGDIPAEAARDLLKKAYCKYKS